MAKIKITNTRIFAKHGGTIKNMDVEITDSELNFKETNIAYSVDESVAIIERLGKAGYQSKISEIISELKKAPPEQQEEIVKRSFLSKVFSRIKDVKPLIESLLLLAKF